MLKNNWVPESATFFEIHSPRCSVLTIVFYMAGEPLPDDAYPIIELPAMLARNDVCQQIKDKPLSDRLSDEQKLIYEDVTGARGRIKQPRYTDTTGGDWIDECERTLTWPEFVGAMKFTIGKYLRRLGKKDDELQELEKVADYAERLLQAAKRRIDTHV